MPIDRVLLQQLKAKPTLKHTGVRSLPRSIHQTPELRQWVTLESVALLPVPDYQDGNWRLISLLTVPKKLENGIKGWLAPWGAVEWSWPEKKFLRKIDLRSFEGTASLRNSTTIPARLLEPMRRTQREDALFSHLERILLTSPTHPVDLAPLAEYYTKLLPVEVYPYYHALLPASRAWLRSDVLTDSEVARQTEQPSINFWQKPTDLSDRVSPWLHECLTLAQGSGLENIASELHTLETRFHLPDFRLAIVGEFNRGKSTLINRLLSRSLISVSPLPHAGLITSIMPGAEDYMEVRFSKEHSEVRPLQLEFRLKKQLGVHLNCI